MSLGDILGRWLLRAIGQPDHPSYRSFDHEEKTMTDETPIGEQLERDIAAEDAWERIPGFTIIPHPVRLRAFELAAQVAAQNGNGTTVEQLLREAKMIERFLKTGETEPQVQHLRGSSAWAEAATAASAAKQAAGAVERMRAPGLNQAQRQESMQSADLAKPGMLTDAEVAADPKIAASSRALTDMMRADSDRDVLVRLLSEADDRRADAVRRLGRDPSRTCRGSTAQMDRLR